MKRPTPHDLQGVTMHWGSTIAIHLIVKDWDLARVSHCQACPGNAMSGGGRRERGFLVGDPQGVEGIKAGLGTSVTASRMTDAYGASTLRVPHG